MSRKNGKRAGKRAGAGAGAEKSQVLVEDELIFVKDASPGLPAPPGGFRLKAVFTREEDGRYSASVPALPGCHSWGETLEQTRAMIREAADAWLAAGNQAAVAGPSSLVEEFVL